MKFHYLLHASVLWFALAISVSASGQTVYRCGSLYSQVSCAGAIAIDASDERSTSQKQQADAVAVQQARAAAMLQRERIAQEKTQAASWSDKTRHGTHAKKDAPAPAPKVRAKAKKKEPDYFTAASRQEKVAKNPDDKLSAKADQDLKR
ncbi:MAG: hypothetical protein ABI343_20280 [Burkholderiaceae bacterium]